MANPPGTRVLIIYSGGKPYVTNTMPPANKATKDQLYQCVVSQVAFMPVAKRASARATLDGVQIYPLV